MSMPPRYVPARAVLMRVVILRRDVNMVDDKGILR